VLETSSTKSILDENFFDSRYSAFKRDRNHLNSPKKSSGGKLITVKRIFNVQELETASGDRFEHVSVKFQCFEDSLLMSATYLVPYFRKVSFKQKANLWTESL
jgi:hypothetical protein